MGNNKKVFQMFALISQLGISIVVPVLLCTFLGTWLEERTSFPLFVPMLIAGVFAGCRNAWVLVKQAIYEPEDKNKRRRY